LARKKGKTWAKNICWLYFLVVREQVYGPAWSRSSSAPDGIKRNKFAKKNKNKNKCFGVNFFLHKQKGNDVI
jgi:hypothetical protein